MIELDGVSRWYGQVIGLNDVSCKLDSGVTALLGANGAGKSTLIKLVTGQLRPTTGAVRVFGQDPFANPEVFRRLGYCPEVDRMYERMTGREFLVAMARYSDMGPRQAKDRAAEVLHVVGMSDRADRRIGSFSKGMRQRVKLAQAMLTDPKVILLDEPLNGLDPIGRRELMNLLGYLGDHGSAIVVSSHILYEVEQMTRSILLLHRGRLLASGDLKIIRPLIDSHPQKVRIETDAPRDLAHLIGGLPQIVSLRYGLDGVSLELEVRDPNSFYETVGDIIAAGKARVRGLSSPDNNLESIFQYLVTT